MRYVLILLILLGFLWAEDYRTIQRNTPIITKEGVVHDTIKDFGNYYAILIYVDDYTYLKKLYTPKKDVEDIAKILKDRYGFIETKIVSNPKNGDELIGALSKFQKKLTNEDNLLIYYAGHGNKEGFWQLKDANSDRVGWIPVEFAVNNTIKHIHAKHIVVISDSCYAGYLTRGNDGDNLNNISLNDKKYYSKLQQLKSRTIFASGGDEPVVDRNPNDPTHSAFASELLNMFRTNDKPIFALEEKFFIVKRNVMNLVKQTPLYKDISHVGREDGGDFIFIDKKSIFANQYIKPIDFDSPDDNHTGDLVPTSQETSNLDTILIYSLGIVSLLLIFVSIIYFRTRKKIDKSNNEEEIPLDEDEISSPPPSPKKGIFTMANLVYQNQPFTKQYTWQEAKEYAENLQLGGFDDWRLPTREELGALGNIKFYGEYDEVFWKEWHKNQEDKALINSKGEKHFIDKRLLENMPKDSWFWTSEAKDEYDIWRVGFHFGCDDVSYEAEMNYVMCVRDKKEGES